MAPDDTPPIAPLSARDIRRLPSDPLTWITAIVVGGVTAAIAGLVGETGGPPSVLIFGVIPTLAVILVGAALLHRREHLAAAALLVGVSPALQAMSGGRWQGAAAAAAALAAVAIPRVAPRIGRSVDLVAAAALTLLLFAVWVQRTPRAPSTPTWATIVTDTGRRLWEAAGTIAQLTRLPATAWLAWWICVGLVAGAAVVAGHWRLALAALGGVGVIVAAGWLIVGWRGTVDMSGGTWILSGSIARAGAGVRPDPAAGRRWAMAIGALLAAGWVVTLVHLARL